MNNTLAPSTCQQASEADLLLVSVFDKKLGTPSLKNIPVGTVLDGIRTGLYPSGTLRPRWAKRNPVVVNWNGTVNNNAQTGQINQYNGLICLRFDNLSEDRTAILHTALQRDPYTFALFSVPRSKGLRVIVRTSSQSQSEHEFFFQKLLEYYQRSYKLSKKEFSEVGKRAKQQCYLLSDLAIYHNPESILIDSNEQFDIDRIGSDTTVKKTGIHDMLELGAHDQSFINSADISRITSSDSKGYSLTVKEVTPENTVIASNRENNELASKEILNDEQRTLAYVEQANYFFEAISKLSERAGQCLSGIDALKMIIDMTVSPDSKLVHEFEMSFTSTRKDKQKHNVQLKYDQKNRTINIVDSTRNNIVSSNREAISIPNVNVYIVSLLKSGDLEQGVIQRKIEDKFQRKNKTVRKAIGQIVESQAVHETTDGNKVVVKKRKDGNKHYLTLATIL